MKRLAFYYSLPLCLLVFIFGYKFIFPVNSKTSLTTGNVSILSEPEKRFAKVPSASGVRLLHFWASWCPICQREHPFLMWLKQNTRIPIDGIDLRDDPDRASTLLANQGNPYDDLAYDHGYSAARYGVHAIPQTLIIDGEGRVRYRHLGAMDQQVWENILLPIIQIIDKE